MFNLEWYRIFLHTAKTGNFTKAAQELFITQPSISYAIKQMEQALGLKMFNRNSKGVELTAEGQALLEYVEKSFLLLDEGEQKLQDLKQFNGGELRVGASDSLFKHLMLPVLDQFHQEFPKIRIRLSHGKTSEIAQRLKEGMIDCGIVHLPLVDPQLDVRPLTETQDCFVVGEAYREHTHFPLTAVELSEIPLLCLSQGSSTRLFMEWWFVAQGITVEVDIELGSIDLLVELAKRGFGAAFISRSFVSNELQAGSLFEIHTTEPIPVRSIGIAVRKSITLPLITTKFIDMLALMP
jgi:DNA-binding transcriptional LysR family regulator